MTKQKSLKKSLAKSAVAMTLCAGMLVGSTYAWFSDEAKTQDITITAGNLDVEIVDENGSTPFSGSLFRDMESEEFLWEPGAMWISETFKVKNLGELALWYSVTLEVDKTEDADSESEDLLKAIKMKVVDMQKMAGQRPDDGDETDHKARQDFWDKIESEKAEVHTGTLNVKDQTSPSLAVVLYWEPSDSTAIDTETNPDNKYNIKDNYDAKKLSAKFHLKVFATQTPKEEDSFGKNYDDSAKGGAFYAAMEDAVADQVESLKQQNVNMTFSVDEATGEPKLTVEPTTPSEGGGVSASALGASYNAVKKAIADALATQQENIQTLTIGGVEPTDFQAENLEKAFVQCLANKYGLTLNEDGTEIEMQQDEALKAIKEWGKQLQTDGYKMNIPVEVVDKNGADVTYNVEIDVKAYKQLIETLAGSVD